MRVSNEQCYVLHSIPYSESSLIVNLFSENYGRVSVLAKGARRLKSQFRGLIRPFVLLKGGWKGKGNVPVLVALSSEKGNSQIASQTYYCCTYLNELIMRLLADRDPHRDLFSIYASTLNSLIVEASEPFTALRIFEKNLLQQLGYELVLKTESDRKTPIREDRYYIYDLNNGPIPSSADDPASFSGGVLIAIRQENFATERTKFECRKFMKSTLAHYLDGRRVHSRDIYSQTIRKL